VGRSRPAQEGSGRQQTQGHSISRSIQMNTFTACWALCEHAALSWLHIQSFAIQVCAITAVGLHSCMRILHLFSLVVIGLTIVYKAHPDGCGRKYTFLPRLRFYPVRASALVIHVALVHACVKPALPGCAVLCCLSTSFCLSCVAGYMCTDTAHFTL